MSLYIPEQAAAQQSGTCDVCSLLEGDRSVKPVQFCNLCKAWICEKCRINWDSPWRGFWRRGKAFLRSWKKGA